MTRAKAIKKYCFDCAGDSSKEVVLCELTGCPLWPYRLGNSPDSKAYQKRLQNYGFLTDSIKKTTQK